jgi:hypothetical protein
LEYYSDLLFAFHSFKIVGHINMLRQYFGSMGSLTGVTMTFMGVSGIDVSILLMLHPL